MNAPLSTFDGPDIVSVALTAPSPADRVAITLADGSIWNEALSAPQDTALRATLAAWIAAGGEVAPYVDPPPVVPAHVTRTQALLALLEHSPPITESAILSAMEGLPEPDREVARILFNNPVWRRDDPFVATLGGVFGLDAAEIDALFIVAATK